MVSLWNLILSGGWIMWPLAICSIAVWAVCVERLWTLRRWNEKNKDFLLSFSNLWLKSDFESARKLCESSDTELSNIAFELLESVKTEKKPTPESLLNRLTRKRVEQAMEMKKYVWILGTIGSAAPFIGLLGTVVGIIRSFQSMAEAGSGGFAVVSAGISEALVATAAGIVVAVIAVFFYNFFQVKLSKLQFQLKLFTEEIYELYIG